MHQTSADVPTLLEFLESYGAPLPFEYVPVLLQLKSVVEEVISLSNRLSEGINMESGFTIEETVYFWEPAMPDEFYEAGLEDELSELFWDIVSYDYQEFIRSFDNYEYFDRDKEIERLAYDLFNGVEYMDSYGIRNYYRLRFTLPGIAEIIKDAYYDDEIWQALEYVAEGGITQDWITTVTKMIEAAKILQQEPTINDADPENAGPLINKVLEICPGLFVKNNVYNLEEFKEEVAIEMRDELESLLRSLVILNRYLPRVVEYYNSCYEAIRYTCEMFTRLASEMAEQYEDIEYWKEFFEANEYYDILAKLFPDNERYHQFAEAEKR